MPTEPASPYGALTAMMSTQSQGEDAVSDRKQPRHQFTIRELEFAANHLRHTGSHDAAEAVDLRIMALLEEKIFRKMIEQSRRVKRSARAPRLDFERLCVQLQNKSARL